MPPNLLDRAFLERFPQAERSTVANRFLDAVRRGISEPDAVVIDVRGQARDRLAQGYRWLRPDSDPYAEYSRAAIAKADGFLLRLTIFADEAHAYARWCLAYEAMPFTERQAFRRGERQGIVARVIGLAPATERQRAYIRVLGGDPASVESIADASALIDQLKAGKR